MRPCSGSPLSEITLERSVDEPLQSTLRREQTLFLEYAMEHATRIESSALFTPAASRTRDTLTLPTQCYAVEFNDDFVTISVIE